MDINKFLNIKREKENNKFSKVVQNNKEIVGNHNRKLEINLNDDKDQDVLKIDRKFEDYFDMSDFMLLSKNIKDFNIRKCNEPVHQCNSEFDDNESDEFKLDSKFKNGFNESDF